MAAGVDVQVGDGAPKRSQGLIDTKASSGSKTSQLTCPTLPLPHASVNEVRDYIRGLLVVKYDVTPEKADSLAVKWKLGRGWNLRELTAAQFEEQFGNDLGPYLHRAVQEEKKAEVLAKTEKTLATWNSSTWPRFFQSMAYVAHSLYLHLFPQRS